MNYEKTWFDMTEVECSCYDAESDYLGHRKIQG